MKGLIWMMKWKLLLVGFLALAVGGPQTWALGPDAVSQQFTISDKTRIPGATLKPGSYSIQVVDHLSDRLIVRVEGNGGSTHSTFLGLPNSSLGKPAVPGPITWGNAAQGTSYLRGWYFPNSASAIEFVYPKGEAVAIAKSNQAKVPAIDPASEGKVADRDLSKDDMEVVTLWLLSSTEVGPNDSTPAIKAERYQQVASAQTPEPLPARSQRSSAASTSSAPSSSAPSSSAGSSDGSQQAVASTPRTVHRKPVIAQLPHTASSLPLLFMLAAFLLAAAAGMRAYRWRRGL